MTAPSTARRSPWPLLELVAHGLILLSLVVFRAEVLTLDLESACQLASPIVLFACFTVIRTAPRGMWSPSSVFMIVVALFHAGLIIPWAMGQRPSASIRDPLDLWMFRDSTVAAIWLTELACIGYVFGTRLAALRPARTDRAGPSDRELDGIITVAGVVFLLVALAGWFLISIGAGGFGLIFGSYEAFLKATEATPIANIYLLADFGVVLLAASPWSRGHTVSLVCFGLWSLIAFPLGLRGEVLFPSLTALSVYAYRRIPLRPRRAVVIAIGLLAAIAVIRNVRAVGLSNVGEASLSFNPLDGVAEMGASLRPVSEVVFWHEMGDDFDDGATYWAPIDRMLYYVVPGWTRPPADEDRRMMTNLIMERAGPIGFSVVAEAYRNFAAPGVFLVLALIGFLLGRLSGWPDDRVYQCLAGFVLIALLGHVRNSFVPVPAQLAIGAALLGALVLFARARAERVRPRPAPR